MKKILLFLTAVSICFGEEPQFNPVRAPCWQCIFPLHVAGQNLTSGHKDFVDYEKPWWMGGCICGFTHWGVEFAFWETQSVIEVTRVPYKFITWGGLSFGQKPKGYEKRGTVANMDAGRTSFYNVHTYAVPLSRLIGVIPGFTCLRKPDVAMPILLSEWDPAWNDMNSMLHWVLTPERFLYASVEAQEICKEDCSASNARKPTDQFTWCAGCLGALYPYSGHVAHHIGGIQASSLLLCRWTALMHSMGKFIPAQWNVLGLGMGFKKDEFCKKTAFPLLQKTFYKTQLIYPIPENHGEKRPDDAQVYCHPLGESDQHWGPGFTYPNGGEDFAYLVWTKRHCCFDLADIFAKFIKVLETKEILTPEQIKSVQKAREVLREVEKLHTHEQDTPKLPEDGQI